MLNVAFASALPQLCFFITWTEKAPPALITKSMDAHPLELDASSNFEPYPYRRMRLHAGGALVV